MLDGFGLRKVSSGDGYNKISADMESGSQSVVLENGSKMGLCRRKLLVRSLLMALLISLFRFVYIFGQESGACTAGKGLCFLYADQDEDANAKTRTSTSTSELVKITAQAQRHGFHSFSDYMRVQFNETSEDIRPLSTSKEFRQKVDSFALFFQSLMKEGHLHVSARALCFGTRGHEVMAMREVGISDVTGLENLPSDVGELKQAFGNDSFDFEFCNEFDSSVKSAAEIARTLKPGGVAVLRTRLNLVHRVYSNINDSFILLFNNCHLVRFNNTGDGFIEIILKKNQNGNCNAVEEWKRKAIRDAEDLIEEEPLKPWITLKRNLKNIKYITNLADISFQRKHVYVDIGARSYGSSIGGWFMKKYPKQGQVFDIYAIEADPAFHKDYNRRKGVTLLPYAAWLKNETLRFEINRDPGSSLESKGMGRIQPFGSNDFAYQAPNKSLLSVQGFDFSEWLKRTVTSDDFVVMKMDIEGTEFELLPKMIETGSICLVDELFLECHYNRWQRCCPERTSKYQHNYSQCLDIFHSLRSMGVLVHQWW